MKLITKNTVGQVALITLEGGGISTVCYGLAKRLEQEKVHTTVFTETNRKQEICKLSDHLEIDRLHRIELPPRFFWFQMQNYRFLVNKLKEFDVIHGVYSDASTMVTRYKQTIRKPLVVSFHAEPFSNLLDFIKIPFTSWTPQEIVFHVLEYPLFKQNYKMCLQKADHIIVCSKSTLKEFEAVYQNKIDSSKMTVIYNAIDTYELDNIFASYKPRPPKQMSIVYAGRLFWLKGLQFLLQAFKKVAKDFPAVSLDIYGKGPEEKKFKALARKLDLEHRVFFHGRLPKNQLLLKMKDSDILVAPSLHEAQSMVVLEGMACQKPVIAFDIPSMKEIILDGYNGLLVRSFDVEALAEKIESLLSDEKLRLRLGKNACEYIKKKHSWETKIQEYLHIYNSLTN
jgi:glycosyltransferase involved in cell wall biosynthesis